MNKVETICDRCQKSILNDYNLDRYKKVPNFFRENYMLFCNCKNHYNVMNLIEMNDYYVMNYKVKK